MEQLSFLMGSQLNIDKTEWEKLQERRSMINECFKTGADLLATHSRVVAANKMILSLVGFDEDNEDEVFIRTKLEASVEPGCGVVQSLQEALLAYDRIVEYVDK